ncbi:MAG: hypothetical protein ACKOEX_08830 [Planctomycetia bacterium]
MDLNKRGWRWRPPKISSPRATDKVAGWLAAGCLEVWSVDPGSRRVEVHTASGGSTLASDADSFLSNAVPGLSVRLADLLPPDS